MSDGTKNCSTRPIHNTTQFSEYYSVEGQLGRGKFAVVKKCRHKQSGHYYAAKFLRKRRKGKDCRDLILHEVQMLEAALEHPRLVDLVEVYETPNELILITDYASGGELHHQIISEEYLPEVHVKTLMRQILQGLMFLHENNLVHLDVKPQNILLTKPFPHGDVKLCDFGFARRVNQDEDIFDIIGTPDYVSPEVLSYEPIQTSADMWSVGVVAYVMLTGYSPFASDDKQETFLNISKVKLDFPEDLFDHVSQDAQDFIQKLLVRNPTHRPSARECLSHPWLSCASLAIPESITSTMGTEKLNSPIGSRRALAPSTPDSSLEMEEPSKRSRCDENGVHPENGILPAFEKPNCESVKNGLIIQNGTKPSKENLKNGLIIKNGIVSTTKNGICPNLEKPKSDPRSNKSPPEKVMNGDISSEPKTTSNKPSCVQVSNSTVKLRKWTKSATQLGESACPHNPKCRLNQQNVCKRRQSISEFLPPNGQILDSSPNHRIYVARSYCEEKSCITQMA